MSALLVYLASVALAWPILARWAYRDTVSSLDSLGLDRAPDSTDRAFIVWWSFLAAWVWPSWLVWIAVRGRCGALTERLYRTLTKGQP